jgi:hypothetical protein
MNLEMLGAVNSEAFYAFTARLILAIREITY